MPSYKRLIANALRDEGRATRFVTTVVSAVSATPALQKCEVPSIISSALQGEALNLSPSPSLGEYAIVPYGAKWDAQLQDFKTYKAKFQIMTNGICQLAMRSGQYEDLDAMEIREGEYKGKDKRTGKPVIEFIEDDDERESKAIIGYYAYFKLLNGFFKSIYLPRAKVIEHAKRFSKAFNYEVYLKVQNGEELGWKEAKSAETPWIQHFDSMAKNLALRKVLKNAPKSIEMRTAEEYEEKNENTIAEVFTPTDAQNDFFAVQEEQPSMIETVAESTEQPKKTKTRKKKETPEQQGFLPQ
jgi:recombination protein RecT